MVIFDGGLACWCFCGVVLLVFLCAGVLVFLRVGIFVASGQFFLGVFWPRDMAQFPPKAPMCIFAKIFFTSRNSERTVNNIANKSSTNPVTGSCAVLLHMDLAFHLKKRLKSLNLGCQLCHGMQGCAELVLDAGLR